MEDPAPRIAIVMRELRRADSLGAMPVGVSELRAKCGLAPDDLAEAMGALEKDKTVTRLPEGYIFTPPDPDADDKPEGAEEEQDEGEEGAFTVGEYGPVHTLTLEESTERAVRVTVAVQVDLAASGDDEDLVEQATLVAERVRALAHDDELLHGASVRVHRVETYEGIRTLYPS
jgi:hypothetical protein